MFNTIVIIISMLTGLIAMSGTGMAEEVRILHTADIHGHIEEFNKYGADCRPKDLADEACFGRFARLKFLVQNFASDRIPTFLFDAGDQFQGGHFYTLWHWSWWF